MSLQKLLILGKLLPFALFYARLQEPDFFGVTLSDNLTIVFVVLSLPMLTHVLTSLEILVAAYALDPFLSILRASGTLHDALLRHSDCNLGHLHARVVCNQRCKKVDFESSKSQRANGESRVLSIAGKGVNQSLPKSDQSESESIFKPSQDSGEQNDAKTMMFRAFEMTLAQMGKRGVRWALLAGRAV